MATLTSKDLNFRIDDMVFTRDEKSEDIYLISYTVKALYNDMVVAKAYLHELKHQGLFYVEDIHDLYKDFVGSKQVTDVSYALTNYVNNLEEADSIVIIENLNVHEEFRRTGIGSSLLDFLYTYIDNNNRVNGAFIGLKATSNDVAYYNNVLVPFFKSTGYLKIFFFTNEDVSVETGSVMFQPVGDIRENYPAFD